MVQNSQMNSYPGHNHWDSNMDVDIREGQEEDIHERRKNSTAAGRGLNFGIRPELDLPDLILISGRIPDLGFG